MGTQCYLKEHMHVQYRKACSIPGPLCCGFFIVFTKGCFFSVFCNQCSETYCILLNVYYFTCVVFFYYLSSTLKLGILVHIGDVFLLPHGFALLDTL